jgi:hypothetical protein
MHVGKGARREGGREDEQVPLAPVRVFGNADVQARSSTDRE